MGATRPTDEHREGQHESVKQITYLAAASKQPPDHRGSRPARLTKPVTPAGPTRTTSLRS
jgi:hypothetical protein